eukprot:CAMPEP_0202959616 /NCGR_PEP_ID=MMETSP1396-20130829/3800_1 /ASSEMBLY_ACC=CAM_ASM_000872 /TAXON_ID= /ORGANISM="Pseudokeronopsis sp., Strain Brazil" /LENGTH=44 /DNA_ID= /DNA_START= /DNA_END= /DNA_ORIENTATION=
MTSVVNSFYSYSKSKNKKKKKKKKNKKDDKEEPLIDRNPDNYYR